MQSTVQASEQTRGLPSCRYFPTLRRNDSAPANEDVRYLQRLLAVFNLKVTTDGKFGAKTEAAVIDFQSRSEEPNFRADGIVGQKTWKALGVCTNNF
jgi:peptidoglycan hydrolase-like protein with peptidoglycan-binding domain